MPNLDRIGWLSVKHDSISWLFLAAIFWGLKIVPKSGGSWFSTLFPSIETGNFSATPRFPTELPGHQRISKVQGCGFLERWSRSVLQTTILLFFSNWNCMKLSNLFQSIGFTDSLDFRSWELLVTFMTDARAGITPWAYCCAIKSWCSNLRCATE